MFKFRVHLGFWSFFFCSAASLTHPPEFRWSYKVHLSRWIHFKWPLILFSPVYLSCILGAQPGDDWTSELHLKWEIWWLPSEPWSDAFSVWKQSELWSKDRNLARIHQSPTCLEVAGDERTKVISVWFKQEGKLFFSGFLFFQSTSHRILIYFF